MSWLSDLLNRLRKPKPVPPAPPKPTPQPGSPTQEMLDLHNQVRAPQHLNPLTINAALTLDAQKHADREAFLDVMDHSGIGDGDLKYRLSNYRYSYAGENLAQGYSVQQTFNLWMGSPAHRSNIMGNFVHVGFGFATSKSGRTYYVGVYATPL